MQASGGPTQYGIGGLFRVAQSINNRLSDQENLLEACRFLVELLTLLLRVDSVCLELPTAILPEPLLQHGAHRQSLRGAGYERIVPLHARMQRVGALRLSYPHLACEGPEDLALAEFSADCLGSLIHAYFNAADSLERLSPAERRVYHLLHLSNLEIGERLYLSHDTVRTHIKRIYKKLGVQTRQEALGISRWLLAG